MPSKNKTDLLKIIHVAPTPFFANRGCHIRIKNEIDALQGVVAGVEIILCTYHHGNHVAGIDTRRIPPIPGYTQTSAGYSPYRFIADILLLWLVLKTVWLEKPKLLHCHLHEGALIGWCVKVVLFWRKLPVLMDMQGSLTGELEAYQSFQRFPRVLRFFRVIETFVYRLPDYIICSSDRSRELLIHDFGVVSDKTIVSGDMIPRTFFKTDREANLSKIKNNIPKDRRVIIYTGSLLPGKGIDDIVEMLPTLIDKHDDLFFILAGYPETLLRSRIIEMGLSSHCMIPGEIPYAELAIWLSTAQVALEPKGALSGEASGKVIHYMAAGVPVVCYDLPNNRSLLQDFGFYARPGDVNDFTRCILDVLDQPESAFNRAKKAKVVVQSRFSQDRIGIQLEQIYKRLINRRKPN